MTGEIVSRGGQQVQGFALGDAQMIRFAAAGAGVAFVSTEAMSGFRASPGAVVGSLLGGAAVGLAIWWVVT